jgi:hypothetical protein
VQIILGSIPKQMSKRTVCYFLAAVLCSVAIYEFPYFLTLLRTGWSPLPPAVNYPADQGMYLNLSAVHHASATELVNPWYGTIVTAVDSPHLRFPAAFVSFGIVHSIFYSWTVAMLVWVGMWAALTFAAAAFCLECFFPDEDRWLIIATSLGLLVLQSPLTYLAEIRALPSTKGLFELSLPFLRFAIPQVMVPAALAYWGLLTRSLKNGSQWLLVCMALLQLVVCAAFPYFLPVLAVGTALTILIAKRSKSEIALSWPAVLVFGATCGLLDMGYLALTGLATSHGYIQLALHFRPEMILVSTRPYVFLLVTASVLALCSRASLAAKVTVAGLALSNALFAFSDVLFPDPTTELRSHVHVLVTATTWLPLLVFLLPWLHRLNSGILRAALGSTLILLGLWEGFASYRSYVSYNLRQAAVVSELQKLQLTPRDLVIDPAESPNDFSCLVPLISPARVLFTRVAEDMLSTDRLRRDQTFRQALLLEMSGINRASFLSLIDPATPLSRLKPIAQFAEFIDMASPLEADHLQARSMVRERLEPALAQLDSDAHSARNLLASYDRVIIIDSSTNPFFIPSAFSRWLEIDKSYESNETKVWICHSKFS